MLLKSQTSNLNVEPIEDVESEPSYKAELYIKDLEAEITVLRTENARLKDQVRNKQDEVKAEVDIDYKIKYHQLLKTFHTTLEEFLPF